MKDDKGLTNEEKAAARKKAIKDIEAWKRQVANYDADRGNDNGKSQKQQKQQNQKQEKDKKPKSKYPTFKYSARLRGKLHEAVLLNGEPVFLTYSSSNGLLKKIEQVKEVNRILVPPCIEEYPYDSIKWVCLSK